MFYAKKLHYCLNFQNQKEKLCAINIIRLKYTFSEGRKISKFFKYNLQIHKFETVIQKFTHLQRFYG